MELLLLVERLRAAELKLLLRKKRYVFFIVRLVLSGLGLLWLL